MPTIVQVYLDSRLVVRTFDPHIYLCLITPSGLVDAATGEIFDTGGQETSALRSQIARFLHNHKDDAGRGKLPLTEDTPSDAKSVAMALSRWDNEGGAVRGGLPI